MSERIRFAIVGAGKRSFYLYAPMLQQLAGEIDLVGVWGRSEGRVRALGEQFHIPWFTDLEKMKEMTCPDAVVVNVSSEANGEIGNQVVQLGMNALLETPIARDLAEADAIITGAQEGGLKIEVAEQYYRRPEERLKRALIDAGLFGRVLTSYSDFMGHGYHGMSMVRSYIGFDAPVELVCGVTSQFEVAPYFAWTKQGPGETLEQWEQATLRFKDGRLGFYHWTSIGYGSSLRWQRSMRFFAEKGMAVGSDLTLLSPDGKDACPIRIERRIHNVGGMETLSELVAHTNPQIVWRNPFRGYYMDDEMIAVADCVMSLARAVRENIPPEYGPRQARLDQALTLAMYASASKNGAPELIG